MKKLACLFFLVAWGCGDGGNSLVPIPGPVAHAPTLSAFDVSPDSVVYMQGDGSIIATAVIGFADSAEDIETLMVEMSTGDSLSIDVSGNVDEPFGEITRQFDVASTKGGIVTIEAWLVDSAGNTSNHLGAEILVTGDFHIWVERASRLPHTLNGVSHMKYADPPFFVAVGDAGTIMTSEDGISWTEIESGTDADLFSVVCSGLTGCFAAGDDGMLLTSWDGKNWTAKDLFPAHDGISMNAYLYNPFAPYTLAAGTVIATDTACLLARDSFDGPWTMTEPFADSEKRITDLGWLYRIVGNALEFQALATVAVPPPEQGRILVSADGLNWIEVFVDDEHASTYTLAYGDAVWVGGSDGRIYRSSDGVNWTRFLTPASNIVSITPWNDGIVAFGFFQGPDAIVGTSGVETYDGGLTWEGFPVAIGYESRGLVYSDERWVSVGALPFEPGKGAIYTTH